MTEWEWLACDDPIAMVAFIRGKASVRKLWLLAAACYRRLWPLVSLEKQGAIKVAEEYGDGKASVEALRRAFRRDQFFHSDLFLGRDAPEVTSVEHAESLAARAVDFVTPRGSGEGRAQRKTSIDVARCVREVFGGHFHPFALPTDCPTLPVASLARAAYEERELPSGQLCPVRLGVLADALEEAGCADEAVVQHLRGYEQCVRCGGTGRSEYDHGYYPPPMETCPNCGGDGWVKTYAPHVRGCWVVDAILGRS